MWLGLDAQVKGLARLKRHAIVSFLDTPLAILECIAHNAVLVKPWIEMQQCRGIHHRSVAQVDAKSYREVSKDTLIKWGVGCL